VIFLWSQGSGFWAEAQTENLPKAVPKKTVERVLFENSTHLFIWQLGDMSQKKNTKPAPPIEAKPANNSSWKYIGAFLGVLIGFYLIYTSAFFTKWFLDPYVHFQTVLSSAVLNLFGANTVADGTQLASARATLSVVKGCDGMEVTALYLIGVLLVPFQRSSKLAGLGYGLLVLFLLNLIRIIALYLAQVYYPASFEFLHLHGGFALFTVVAILMWTYWANWALKREKTTEPHAAV
jgi:exosortase/archaeosortase family protein